MITGACLCGEVRFEIDGDLPDLYRCHCSLCRKATGAGANAATFIPAARFRWAGASGIIRSFVRQSGYRNDFCSHCGSSVPNLTADGNRVWVPAGLLDGSIAVRVCKHIHVASKASWDEIGETGLQFSGPPDRLP